MRPTYWGKYFWKVIHITALGYPDDPDEDDKEVYKRFFETMGKVLPCNRCSNNYRKHIETLALDNFLDSSANLFKWTVLLHNVVSKDLGKPQWNVEYAESFYKAEEQRSFQHEQPQICPTTIVSEKKNTTDKGKKMTRSGFPTWLSIMLIIVNLVFVVLIALFLWRNL